MRIDEFSAPTDIDGSLSTEEITRFLLFGFDITISPPAVVVGKVCASLIVKISEVEASIKMSNIDLTIKGCEL